ncbi:proline racemase family protein [Virgibacillus halodenitrificans]|uniref:proline racemase family protein n=1 Tax=Virgibacillus halodenitrificans TaxID=1482 RepID=UPI00045D2DA7|nr:proline racemase family protein [Virgibacillus halodenitrificans]CDQ31284.1 4-hydroxyproline epimerase [Virgibacillus halodenitrificans]
MKINKMLTTIDTHVCGEIFRIITYSPMQLTHIKSEQNALTQQFSKEKALLLNEPRGHRGVNGCIVTPSNKADYAVSFIHHENERHFSYSGLLATLTALLETGNIQVKEDGIYHIETIKGTYPIHARFNNSSQGLELLQIESNVCKLIEESENYSLVEIDYSRRYVLFQLPKIIPEIDMAFLSDILKWGKQAVDRLKETVHFEGVILAERIADNEFKSVTFERDGAILRSPGMDTTFALCTAFENGREPTELVNRSIFGSEFRAKGVEGSERGYSIQTRPFVTGEHQFIYDQEDPLEEGFLLK